MSLHCSSQMEFTPTTIMFATHDLLKMPVDVSKSRMVSVKQSQKKAVSILRIFTTEIFLQET